MLPHHLALLVTAALLLALMTLGLSLQLGARRAARWPHHALFLAVSAGTGLAGTLSVRAGQAGWALLPALLLLLSMPRTRPGHAGHWQRALLCAGAYLGGAALAWGGHA